MVGEVLTRQTRGPSLSREGVGGVRWDLGREVVEGEAAPYLVVKEVFWKVEGQGEYWEQEPPNPNRRVAGVYE